MKAKEPSSFLIFGCFFNGCAIFFLPLLLLLGCSSILDVSDIVDTGDVLGFIFLCLILPSFLGMITNTIVKVRKEYRYFKRENVPLRFAQKLDIIQKHSVMLTYRGWFFLGTSCFYTSHSGCWMGQFGNINRILSSHTIFYDRTLFCCRLVSE